MEYKKGYLQGIYDCWHYLEFVAANQRCNNGVDTTDLEQLTFEMRCDFDPEFKKEQNNKA